MNSCSDALFVGVENGNNRPFYTLPDLILIYGYNFQRSGKQTCSDKTDLIDHIIARLSLLISINAEKFCRKMAVATLRDLLRCLLCIQIFSCFQ